MRALFFINYMKLFCSWQVVQHVCVFVSIVRRAHNTHQINWEIKYVNEREKKLHEKNDIYFSCFVLSFSLLLLLTYF